MRLYMTEGEITAMFRGAKDKVQQIQILSELNACSHSAITDVLLKYGLVDEAGIPIEKPKPVIAKPKTYVPSKVNRTESSSTHPWRNHQEVYKPFIMYASEFSEEIASSVIKEVIHMQDGTSNNESTLDDSGRIVEQAGNRDSDTSESRQRKSWDTSSIIELLGYIIAGKTNGDIAVLMDSSIHNISNLMSRKGITRGNAKLKLEEYSIADDTQDKKDSTEYNSTPYDKQTTLQPASTVDFSLISSKIRLAKQLADEYCEYKDLISNERDPIKLGRLYQVLIELEEQVREWQ